MKTLRKALCLFALVLFAFSVDAQILYKVVAPSTHKTGYLLGTHHFAPLSVVDSISEMSEILKSIDKVYGEIDMSEMADPMALMKLQNVMMAPVDSTLDKLLTPERLDSVERVWKEYAPQMLPFNAIKMMKPARISTQLAAFMASKILPEINGMEGIDMTMQKRAKDLGKEVGGLETMEYQMNMLMADPISKQAESLMKMIRDIDDTDTKTLELTQAYLNHDLDKILELMLESEASDPESAERLIYTRNDNWVSRLKDEMPQQSILVVVGAGHLPGERGVIESLRKAGFKVTPIR